MQPLRGEHKAALRAAPAAFQGWESQSCSLPSHQRTLTAASATLVWFDCKNRAQTGVSEEKLLLLLSALSEPVNSYWNPAEEGCQPGRGSLRVSADVNQEDSVISTELAHNS